jgi:hypothetical protein
MPLSHWKYGTAMEAAKAGKWGDKRGVIAYLTAHGAYEVQVDVDTETDLVNSENDTSSDIIYDETSRQEVYS